MQGEPKHSIRLDEQDNYADVEAVHKKQQATRRLIHALRKRLVKEGAYAGTKLAQLDEYHAKLSELSHLPLVLRPGVQRDGPTGHGNTQEGCT